MFNNNVKTNKKIVGSKHLTYSSLLMASLLTLLSPAQANNALPESLKVCAAGNEMPYSNTQQQGFENEIAKVLADSMDMPLEFVWSDKAAIFLVTEHLLKNECDVVMGVDSDDPRVATSTPYYKSGYVFVYRTDKNLNITDWHSADIQKLNRFVVIPGSPSEVMLREVGKFEGNFNYTKSLSGYKSPRNQYIRLEPSKLIGEVTSGNGDIAHLWAPEVARYVRDSNTSLEMVLSPELGKTKEGEGIVQHYDQSVAVREDDKALLDAINKGLAKAAPQITAILEKEGIPLL